jgi:DNA-binding response OmpR family regulator
MMTQRILVVDDEENNRELLEAILTPEGYDVKLAADGPSALADAAATPPDLILLDLLMPTMSGYETAQHLKELTTTATVPVIVVTALGLIGDKEAALTCGADDYVVKPIQAEDLRARVRAMLRVRHIHHELDRTLAYLHELQATRSAVPPTPVAPGTPAAPPPPVTAATPIPILLVDDDEISHAFYGSLLADRGFQVLGAATGEEALELVRRQPIEAALLDIVLPGMSGLELLERLHAQDPDLPAIMLTAHATSQHAIAALKLGALDFIVKGAEAELVVLAVHRAVRQRHEQWALKAEIRRLQAQLVAQGTPGYGA